MQSASSILSYTKFLILICSIHVLKTLLISVIVVYCR